MDQQPYGQMIGCRNLTGNDHHRFRKQMGRLVRPFAGQPCEQMALHIQLIADRRLSFESRLIIRHRNFHRLVIIQTEAESSLRKLLRSRRMPTRVFTILSCCWRACPRKYARAMPVVNRRRTSAVSASSAAACPKEASSMARFFPQKSNSYRKLKRVDNPVHNLDARHFRIQGRKHAMLRNALIGQRGVGF